MDSEQSNVYSQGYVTQSQGYIWNTLQLLGEHNVFHHSALLNLIQPGLSASAPGIFLEFCAANKAVRDAVYSARQDGRQVTSADYKIDSVTTRFGAPVPLLKHNGGAITPVMRLNTLLKSPKSIDSPGSNVDAYHQCTYSPHEGYIVDAFNDPKVNDNRPIKVEDAAEKLTPIEESATRTQLRTVPLDSKQFEREGDWAYTDIVVPEDCESHFERLEEICNMGSYLVNGESVDSEHFAISRQNNIPLLLAGSCAKIIAGYCDNPDTAKQYASFFEKLSKGFDSKTLAQIRDEMEDPTQRKALEKLIAQQELSHDLKIPTFKLPIYTHHDIKFYEWAKEIKPGDVCRVWLVKDDDHPDISGNTYQIKFTGTLKGEGDEWRHLFDFDMAFKANKLKTMLALAKKGAAFFEKK